jgi:hypothetical protein
MRSITHAANLPGTRRFVLVFLFTASAIVCERNAVAKPPDAEAQSVIDLLDTASLQLRNRQPHDARETLKTAEQSEPENPWIRHFQGLASLQLHDPHRAVREFDLAARDLSIEDPLEKLLLEEVAVARQAARREIIAATATMGLAYDTNVSFLGDSGTLDLVANQPDGLFQSSFMIDYAPVSNGFHTFAVGTRLAHSWHFDIDSFDVQSYGGYLRYTRRFNPLWSATIRYDYDFTLLGRDPFLSNHALTPSLRYDWPINDRSLSLQTTEVYYRLQHQDYLYETDPDFDRDGLAHAFGIQQGLAWTPNSEFPWTCDLTAGYVIEGFNNEGREFDRLEHNFLISLDAPLLNPREPGKYLLIPDGELRFRFSAQWQIADYKNPSLNDRDRDERADLISSYGFALSQRLRSDPKRGDLTLHAVVLWTDADSNITLRNGSTPFSYQKVVYGLQLSWSF